MGSDLADAVTTLATVWLALMGLVIGSFLNVVIGRLPAGESIVRPRSRCPRCGHTLCWYENIPLLSWAALRGRCRSCRAPISLRYPLVEALTAALFLLCLARFGWTWELVIGLMMVVLVIPLTFIDLQHWILPLELTVPGIALAILTAAPLGLHRVRDAAVGAALGFGVFWALEWVGRKAFGQEALGGGDKYLLSLLCGFLTYRAILGVIFFASFQGSIVGLTLKAVTGRAGPAAPPAQGSEDDDWVPGPSNLPLGPWLSAAGLELLLAGPWLAAHLPVPLGTYLTGG